MAEAELEPELQMIEAAEQLERWNRAHRWFVLCAVFALGVLSFFWLLEAVGSITITETARRWAFVSFTVVTFLINQVIWGRIDRSRKLLRRARYRAGVLDLGPPR